MDKRLFLERARKWHVVAEPDGMHSRTLFYTVVDGEPVFFKGTHRTFHEDGSDTVEIILPTLACGCVVEDPNKSMVIGGVRYCREHVHTCPSCGKWIVPGTGEQVEQAWYHRTCADPHRQHVEAKRAAEERFLAARATGAEFQALLTRAQIEGVEANTHAVYENVRLHEREQRRREMETEERLELEKKAAELKEAALNSQLESEALQRGISYGQFQLDWAERIHKLEREGALPEGSVPKRLP